MTAGESVGLGFATEQVVGLRPFTVRRVVRWHECDPAGIAFTGVFPVWVISGLQLLRAHVTGGEWGAILRREGLAAPAKAMTLAFHGAVTAGDAIDLVLGIRRLGERSVTWSVVASAVPDRRPVFDGAFTTVFAAGEGTALRSRTVPPALRALIRAHASLALDDQPSTSNKTEETP